MAFVDLLRTCGAFSNEEAREYIETGCLNGLFVLGRTIGFIGKICLVLLACRLSVCLSV